MMIVTGTYPKPEHPVIRDLREALGEAIDRQQVAIVRAYLDGECPSTCPCACHLTPGVKANHECGGDA